MKRYMNEPVDYVFTDEDVVKEYKRFSDIKRTASVFCIDAKIVKQILKKKGER
uniref:hypothetical protein n=1 Tax=Clostridium sp. 12(A) TaxID=1163671 RepID=UPI0004B3B5D9|nr:hypothetical protein [Clostridium sp. 12(A)]